MAALPGRARRDRDGHPVRRAGHGLSDRFTTGAEFRDFMRANYGPTLAVYRYLAEAPDKVDALDADLAALGERFITDGVMSWEYLLVTARRS